jgi:ABC-2 type transport system permease protein
MTPSPGSFLWLVAHDVRLNWRRFADMIGAAAHLRASLLVVAGALVLHAVAWPVAPWVAGFVDRPESQAEVRLALAGVVVSLLCWMTAQGLFVATRTLYERGDLDLLYGSPLNPRRILAAKTVAIALSSLGSVAMLVLPVANVTALRFGGRWLAAYPVLAGLALLATALAIMVTIALFYAVGRRRARLVAQIMGALIGGGFVLGLQIVAMLPDSVSASLAAAFAPGPVESLGLAGRVLWMPVDALLGGGLEALSVVALGGGLLAAVSVALGRRFAWASLEAAGAPSVDSRRRTRATVRFCPGPYGSLRRKEWRLLARDPSLFTQLALQIVYTIPLAVVLIRGGTLPLALALAPAIIVIAAQVSASLAWIAVSGEDAPELIASAPVDRRAVEAAKLSAIALPVAIVAALPLAGLALVSPVATIVTAVFAAGASLSTALLNLWHPMPGNRRGMLRRHAQSKLIGLLEHLLAILWAIAAVLALLGSYMWPILIVLAGVVLATARFGGTDRRRAKLSGPNGLQVSRIVAR